jgi:ferredoxin
MSLATPLHRRGLWAISRVIRQDGDTEEVIQEAIETCPVDCIHWVITPNQAP